MRMPHLPDSEIIRRVEEGLRRADYPTKKVDPSTVHYALKRMVDDGLVEQKREQEVDVPGPRGTVRREARTVYVITGLGATALRRRLALNFAAAHQSGRSIGVAH